MQSPRFCANCGTSLSSGARACQRCGQPVITARPIRPYLWLGVIAVAGLCLVASLATAGLFLWLRTQPAPTQVAALTTMPSPAPSLTSTPFPAQTTPLAVNDIVLDTATLPPPATATFTSVPTPAPPTPTNTESINLTVSPAASATLPPTASPTPIPPPPVDQAAMEQEQSTLAPHPGYQRYAYYDLFSLNIPADWQYLSTGPGGRDITLGRLDDVDARFRTLTIGLDEPGRDLTETLNQRLQSMGGAILLPSEPVSIGHYPARQVVVERAAPYARRTFLAAVSAPGYTYVLSVDVPNIDGDGDIIYEAAVNSFRTPAPCGQAACPDLVARGEAPRVSLHLPPAPSTFRPVAGAINVFFTVGQLGKAWGYAVDQQGQEIYPAEDIPTISIQTHPGDRIILQTDAAGFSLLFDCGTSPQAFSPCDFTADSPAGLPGEIVANGGSSAYLNISGPDNWAGPRPNFPTQRYPADPVMRIILEE